MHRYAFSASKPLAVGIDKAVAITCGNRTLDLQTAKGGLQVAGSLSLHDCILLNLGSGGVGAQVPKVVPLAEMIRHPVLTVQGGYFQYNDPQRCKVCQHGIRCLRI